MKRNELETKKNPTKAENARERSDIEKAIRTGIKAGLGFSHCW